MKPPAILEIGLWARDYQEIDLFNWQEARPDLLTVSDMERELAVAEDFVRRAIERGQIVPDHSVSIGERTYHYFKRDSIAAVRTALGVPEVGDDNIKDMFTQYVADMDMSASYKPVLLLAVLDAVDANGRASLKDVVAIFRNFFNARRLAGLVVEAPRMRMANVENLDDSAVQQVMLGMPFRKFEQRRYLRYDRDLAFIRVEPSLWRQLKPADLAHLRTICKESIQKYYARLDRS